VAQSIVVGAEDDAAPWSYADGSGYANDIVRLAFERAGWSVRAEGDALRALQGARAVGRHRRVLLDEPHARARGRLLFSAPGLFQAQNLL
jgi:hypothetical protein